MSVILIFLEGSFVHLIYKFISNELELRVIEVINGGARSHSEVIPIK